MIDCWVCVDCVHFWLCEKSAFCEDFFERCDSCKTGQRLCDSCFVEKEEEKQNGK